ncbi:MAG: phosphate ABC transporter permease PstC, partial [Bacteroidia bacterium]|nr:phosphate ABC transporter permease PstC [Bacteroidia bacterium]
MTNPPPGSAVRRSPLADRLFGWAAQGAAWLTLGLLAGILVSLVIG